MASTVTKYLVRARNGFINFIGNIQVQKRPLFLIYNPRGYKFKDTLRVLKLVRPGDVILRRYDTYLSGKFIPGKWSHCGLVVDKTIIVHAIGKGVTTEDIIQFCRTDAICILRRPDLSKKDLHKIITKTMDTVGKPYDYSFNVEDNNALFCSELVTHCLTPYISMKPKREKVFGIFPTSATVTPTHLYESKELEVIFDSTKKS